MSSQLNRMVVCLSLTTALTTTGTAWAQQDLEEPDPNVTVQDRPRPDYDPLGIRAGTFLVFPSLSLEGGYDDNVYAESNDEDDDFFATLRPEIDARSDWNRHALNFGVAAEGARYLEEDNNDYLDFFSNAEGRLDISRDNILTGGIEVNRLHEDRESPDDAGQGQDVTEYWNPIARLAYRRNFNRIYTQIGADLTRFDFKDNDDINEDDRDRNQYRGRLRAGYEISPRISAFGEGIYEIRDYDQTPNDQGVDRNSEGYSLRAGTEIDITGLLFGEVALGYTHREYDDDTLDDVGGLGGGGTLTWNVTPLTTIIFEGTGEVRETTVSFEGDEASGRFDKEVAVDVTHELLRNVLLNATASYTRSDFEGTSRSDDIYRAGGGITYLINRNLSLDASYRYSKRDSDDNDAEFTRNIVLLGITARL